jgi:pentose-5-phosphate-3-epimerase
MCADYGHLEGDIRALEAAGVDAFHVDIMNNDIRGIIRAAFMI